MAPKMKGWVARDKDTGIICWYSVRPTNYNGLWGVDIGYEVKLENEFLPEVTYDNSPQECEIMLSMV